MMFLAPAMIAGTASRGGGAAVSPMADTYITSANGGEQINTTAGATFTFATVTIGAADARRRVVLAMATNGVSVTHTGLTANAGAIVFTLIAATGATADTANTNYISIWEASVPSGTTLTAPILTCSASTTRACMIGWTHGRGAATGTPIKSGAASVTAPANFSGSINVPANGMALAFFYTTTTTTQNITWTVGGSSTGVTENVDSNAVSSMWRTGMMYLNDAVADTGVAVQAACATDPSSNVRLVVAAFGATT